MTTRPKKKAGKQKPSVQIEPAAGKPILITDVALRDGHQSLLATRMRTEDMLPIAQKLDAVGYWSLEVWGGAICYTVSPVHSIDRFVDMAKKLEDLGTDTLCIKDMAGLLAPLDAYHLIRRIKAAVKVPIHLHSHYTSGMASMTSLMAILGGLDMLDTSISPLAGGTSHPSTETLVASLRNTPYDTGLDLASFLPITEHFRSVRRKYRQFEREFTGGDAEILTWQIPGGMLSNLAAQLTEQNALDRIKEVLD